MNPYKARALCPPGPRAARAGTDPPVQQNGRGELGEVGASMKISGDFFKIPIIYPLNGLNCLGYYFHLEFIIYPK